MSDISKTCARMQDGAASLILGARLKELDGYWLELHCCAGITLLPVRLVVTRQGGQHRLGHLLPRLKCKLCGSPPAKAFLNETPNCESCHGAPPGWSVALPVGTRP